MITEYWKKIGSFAKWLVPFVAAIFLLFGCGPAQGGTQQPVPETYSAVQTAGEATEDRPGEGAEDKPGEVTEGKPGEMTEGRPGEAAEEVSETAAAQTAEDALDEDGSYTSKSDVALYLHIYGRLPKNFITKKDAEAAGWVSSKGNLWDVAPGMSIGGSRFGNYEGTLPEKDGRTWYECDIAFDGGFRGAQRIVYSNDGLIYYTGDHYKTFEELFGDQ